MSAGQPSLPSGLLLAYYGDDFTGSTDAMEAMESAGVPTLLFLNEVDPRVLARFPQVRCVGRAGVSRARSPQWMEQHLPAIFDSLAGLGAPILHYKVCSTFDSAPHLGSIGKAIDIGSRTVSGAWVPIVVGAPRLGRYQAFGHLFAMGEGATWRLDRHPTMARHPVTPMGESELRLHLSAQTQRRIELIDLVQLKTDGGDTRADQILGADAPAVFLDVLDDQTLLAAGRLVWERRGRGVFSASSSGLQSALTSYWRSIGAVAPQPSGLAKARSADAIAAVSGSCSPVTATQIRWARANGFVVERMNVSAVLTPDGAGAEVRRCVGLALDALRAGASPLIYSAEGPEDPHVKGFAAMADRAGLTPSEAAQRIGAALSRIMSALIESAGLKRVVVAGGDSSGEVAGALGITALSVTAELVPGAPLCQAWSDAPRLDGLEIVLKGGQMGPEDFFGIARSGMRDTECTR